MEAMVKVKKILVVEDDREMQELYKYFFRGQENKYSIQLENNAERALEKTKKEKFDLIILDIIMEPMSGDSFFIYLRGDKKNKTTPVLVVSVLRPDTLQELKKINHINFVQKPITKELLMQKLEEIL